VWVLSQESELPLVTFLMPAHDVDPGTVLLMRAGKMLWIPVLAIGVCAPVVTALSWTGGSSDLDTNGSVRTCLTEFDQELNYTATVDCLTQVAQQASSKGYAGELVAALAIVRQEESIEEYLCHAVAHNLGELEMERLDHDVLTLVEEVPALPCTSGVLHGALIAWGESRPDLASRTEVAQMCRDLANGLPKPDRSVPYHDFGHMNMDCADGFGHAMWQASDDDPIEALELCRVLEDDSLIRFCILGVGMEGAEARPEGDPPVSLDDALNVIAPWCTGTNEPERSACAAMLAIPFGAELGALPWRSGSPSDANTVSELASAAIGHCSDLLLDSMREACLTELSTRTVGQFEGNATWLCPLMPREYIKMCRTHQQNITGNGQSVSLA